MPWQRNGYIEDCRPHPAMLTDKLHSVLRITNNPAPIFGSHDRLVLLGTRILIHQRSRLKIGYTSATL